MRAICVDRLFAHNYRKIRILRYRKVQNMFSWHDRALQRGARMWMAARHGGGRGGFLAGLGDGEGFGGRGFPAGRKLSSGDLQLLLLALLEEKSSHGYELIKALEERSGGFYTPSPGMVYPALTYLEEIGYADVTAEGSKKRYTITDAGRAHLAENRSFVEHVLSRLQHIGQKMDRVRRAFAGESDERDAGARELQGVRHALRSVLHAAEGADADEQRRIAQILLDAVDAIKRGKTPASD
jgi:DNA-binding PadR family transcriptional regulator